MPTSEQDNLADGWDGDAWEQDGAWPKTHWSILQVIKVVDGDEKMRFIGILIRHYWRPVYHHLRGLNFTEQDARDLTQRFFLDWIEKGKFDLPDKERGSFRKLLKTAVRNFGSNARAGLGVIKGKAGQRVVSIDELLENEPAERFAELAVPPEEAFDRAWYMDVLQRAFARLKVECEQKGRQTQHELFLKIKIEPFTKGTVPPSHREAAALFGIKEVQVGRFLENVWRMLRRILVEDIKSYLTDKESLDEELKGLFAVFN